MKNKTSQGTIEFKIGYAACLLQQMRKKFAISPDISLKVTEASLSQMEDWALAVIDANSIEEVFGRNLN